MQKPDFSKMTRKELRTYILENNREDDDAIEALINRESPNSRTFPYPPTDEDLAEMQELLKRKPDGMDAA